MPTMTVKINGLKEIGQQLQHLSADVQKRIARAATAAGARVILKRAKANLADKTTQRTGALNAGLTVMRIRRTNLTSEHAVTVSTRTMKKYVEKSRAKNSKASDSHESLGDLFYGKFIEFGTVRMAARPFLGPAYDSEKEAASRAIVARLEARIKKANEVKK